MLDMSNTRTPPGGDEQYDLASNAGSFQEGAFMIHTMENGKGVVTPCAGAAGEVFAGVAKFYRQVPATGPIVEDVVGPANPYQVTLLAAPIGGEAAATFIDVSTGVPGAAIAGGNVTVSGAVVTFTAAEVGKKIRITYVGAYTQALYRRLVGDGYGPSTATPNSPLASVGLIKKGPVATSYYDTAVNWNVAGSITLAAGGKVTLAGSGEALNAVVKKAPDADSPFLVLELK